MAKLTYANKVALNPQPSIARINKVTDDDMNEIKSVVNTNDDNVGNIANLNTTDKTSIVNAINSMQGTILWTNSNPNTAFSAQNITLSSSNYDFLEIIFNNQGYYKSVRVDKGKNILLDGLYYGNGTTIYYAWRFASINSNTEIHFEGANLVQIQGSNSSFQNNNHCIPSYIIGYKTGLFS